MPYFHTQAEKKDWISAYYVHGEPIKNKNDDYRLRMKEKAEDQLEFNDGWRHDLERERFWAELSTRLQAEDISLWEKANELNRLVSRERNRRCLWAYAMAQAKVLKVATCEQV